MGSSTNSSRRKILVPLASMLAAGAIAVGSGASFTSTSQNSSSAVTSGTLKQSNSKADAAIFTLTDMKPGDTVNGALTIANTGSLPAAFSLTESSSSNAFTERYLTLTVTNQGTGVQVFSGRFGDLVDGQKVALGNWKSGDVNTFVFSAHLDQAAPNSEQNKVASASYTWDSVQLDGETFEQ